MTSYRFFLGIDVSKRTLDCFLFDGASFDRDSMTNTLHTVPNSEEGSAQLIKWLTGQDATPDSTVCCMENTGFN